MQLTKKDVNLLIITSVLLVMGFTFKTEENIAKYNLFKIERSKDINEIRYDLNLDSSGKINLHNPIQIYWLKKTEDNNIEPLTWIQKKYAYGLKFLDNNCFFRKDIENPCLHFQFVSYEKRTFTLKRIQGEYKVLTEYRNKEIAVSYIYVNIDGGTFWVPEISGVELHGIDLKSGKPVVEVVCP